MDYLSTICPFRLNESYDSLYNLEQKLSLDEDYFSSTSRNIDQDKKYSTNLRELLNLSKMTRDNLITWHMKQPLVELNVTISLLTAKIKLIEYKLGLCEGLDLHQACSLSLVDFCNILADMTVLNVKPTERKTMHMISNQAGVPVWLSHYRNQICHVPSESPCISILVPLVLKALTYMKDSFWTKILERESFDKRRCSNIIGMISTYTDSNSINQYLGVKKSPKMSSKKSKLVTTDKARKLKTCSSLRKLIRQNPDQVIDALIKHITLIQPKDKTKNCSLLLEQVILARTFEQFLMKFLSHAEKSNDKNVIAWLYRLITLISLRKKESIRRTLKKMDLWVSVKMVKLTEIPSIKCCQIAYRLLKIDHPVMRRLVIRMRYKLLPILGKKRTLLLIQLAEFGSV